MLHVLLSKSHRSFCASFQRGTALFLLFSFLLIAVPIAPASAAIRDSKLGNLESQTNPVDAHLRAEQALEIAGVKDIGLYKLDKWQPGPDQSQDSEATSPQQAQAPHGPEASFQRNPQDVIPKEPNPAQSTVEEPKAENSDLPVFPSLPKIAQAPEDPPEPEDPVDPEEEEPPLLEEDTLDAAERRSKNQMPIVSLPGKCFKVAGSRWSRMTHHGAQFRDVSTNPFCYANDESIVFSEAYEDIAHPTEETIVWDFISPVAERNMTTRNSAASVQFRYISQGELTIETGTGYTL